jgi:hypothetical protein
MVDHFPANFVPRHELEHFLKRLLLLRQQSHGELAKVLKRTLASLASLDGLLHEMRELGDKASHRYPDVFASDVVAEWHESNLSVTTDRGLLSLSLGQQVLRIPDGDAEIRLLTDRYRIRYGRKIHVAHRPEDLQPYVESYLDRFRSVLPEGFAERCTAAIFDLAERSKEG